jgi:hypothetical protein
MTVPVVFSTGSLYSFGLERIYSWAAEAGYHGVEIMVTTPPAKTASMKPSSSSGFSGNACGNPLRLHLMAPSVPSVLCLYGGDLPRFTLLRLSEQQPRERNVLSRHKVPSGTDGGANAHRKVIVLPLEDFPNSIKGGSCDSPIRARVDEHFAT